jgi:tetratricopeptide (TPR) repeat protein
MKILPALLFLFAALGVNAQQETFQTAKNAYDAGHYTEAAMHYETLLSNGVSNIEVEYNLANAYFKNGQLADAVWHYRKAWYTAPRDPDIRANLSFALDAAGANMPTSNLLEQSLAELSQTEWIKVSVAAYLFFILLLALGQLIRPARRFFGQFSLLPAFLLLVALGGWWHWQQYKIHPESVIVKNNATALYGPVEGSTEHYKVPLAALVRQRATDAKGWTEIEYDGKVGWLKDEYIVRISP